MPTLAGILRRSRLASTPLGSASSRASPAEARSLMASATARSVLQAGRTSKLRAHGCVPRPALTARTSRETPRALRSSWGLPPSPALAADTASRLIVGELLDLVLAVPSGAARPIRPRTPLRRSGQSDGPPHESPACAVLKTVCGLAKPAHVGLVAACANTSPDVSSCHQAVTTSPL
jgi:hypothetical protein